MTTTEGVGAPTPSTDSPFLLREVLAKCEITRELIKKARLTMGYNVNTTGINFTIPADKLDAACQAMKDLNKHDELKSGGGWDGKQRQHWFSWMPANYDQTMDSAQEILEALGFETASGFETEDGKPGDLSITGYADKAGDEDKFLAALAPFVPDGSYVNWEGEDGIYWQHWFEAGQMIEKSGSIIYS